MGTQVAKAKSTVTIRILITLTTLAMVTAACTSDDETVGGTEEQPPSATEATVVTEPPTTVSTAEPPVTTVAPVPSGFTYRMGMTEDLTSTNYWAYWGPESTAFMGYVLSPTKPSLFSIEFPGVVTAPYVASDLPAEPVQEGDVWTVTQSMRPDFVWSDGTPVTADDVVFTFQAVRDAGLGGQWVASYPHTEASSPRLLSVEAVAPNEVQFTFDARPGLAVWPYSVGVAPIMPKHAWEPVLQQAVGADDPATVLYGASPAEVGDVSGGPVTLSRWESGAFVVNVANDNYSNEGVTHSFYDDGTYGQDDVLYYGEGAGEVTVEYTEGPYLDEAIFSIYGDQASAMLALLSGEIDYWINPLGAATGLRNEGLAADNLGAAINPPNGFRYLAFNLRKSPGQFKEFREAVAFMIDKEFLATNVLQGVALPLYVLILQGNRKWYNEEVADEVASRYVGLSAQERITKAVDILKQGGFTWEREPSFDEGSGEIVNGVGLIDPDGNRVPELEVMAPPAAFDPLRATAALWVEGWLEQLGVSARAKPTDFNTLASKLWPGIGEDIPFDMYILGWELSAFPDFHGGFFHSRNLSEVNFGANTTGYVDEEFDALVDAFSAATSEEEAYDLIWQMERKLADDLPYVVLFNTPIIEFYNKEVVFPFVDTLNGIQHQAGFQGDVRIPLRK